MSSEEEIVASLEIGRLELSLKNLDMSMDQDLPWRDVFDLKDLKFLFSREIDECDDPYTKSDIDLCDCTLFVEDIEVDEMKVVSEDVTLHLENSKGSIDLKLGKHIAEYENVKTKGFEVILTEATIAETVISKLKGCDFGLNIFPPSTGLSCTDETNLVIEDVTTTLTLDEDLEKEINEMVDNLYFENMHVSEKDLSVTELDVSEEEVEGVDLEELGSKTRDIDVKIGDFNFDSNNGGLDFGSLEFVESGVDNGVSFNIQNYRRDLKDLVRNFNEIMDNLLNNSEEE